MTELYIINSTDDNGESTTCEAVFKTNEQAIRYILKNYNDNRRGGGGTECDNCDELIDGDIYHCMICEDFDFCEKCHKLEKDKHKHKNLTDEDWDGNSIEKLKETNYWRNNAGGYKIEKIIYHENDLLTDWDLIPKKLKHI